MVERPNVVGAILTGGRSERFGSPKALAQTGQATTMGARVVAAMRSADLDPVIAVGGGVAAELGLPHVADLWPGQGPLGGVATILLWAKRGAVLVSPCDLPFLSAQDVRKLVSAHLDQPDASVVATVDGKRQIQLICMPATHGPAVRDLINDGLRRYNALLGVGRWIEVEVDPWSLADADTPEELKELLALRQAEGSAG